MAEYVLSCETTADLSKEKADELGLECICFHFYINGTEHPDDMWQTISAAEFYQAMVDGAEMKTAAIGTGEYVDFFRGYLEQGKDILHVSLSSGLSAAYDSAATAAEMLREEYPERAIYVVDSLAASSGYGLIMQALSERKAAGIDIEELYEWIEANKLHVHHWFFSTDLTFYIKGGRVKPVAGFVGNLLGICPLLNVDSRGCLIPREKIRSKKKVIKRIVEKMIGDAKDGTDYDGRVFISNSACEEDAQEVARLVEKTFPQMKGKVEIFPIGTTIGSHTGPGTVALFFWGVERGL